MSTKTFKNLMKIVAVLLMIFMLVSISYTTVMAKSQATNPNTFSGKTDGLTNVQSLGERIIGFVQLVGSLAAIIVLIVIGIKYLMGSTEEKAEYKKTMLPYIVGAALVFAASNIAGMIYNFADKI